MIGGLLACPLFINLHAQSGDANVPTKCDVYTMEKPDVNNIFDTAPLTTSCRFPVVDEKDGEPRSGSCADTKWTVSDTTDFEVVPEMNSSTEIKSKSGGKKGPFAKSKGQQIKITAAYTGSACVDKGSNNQDIGLIYVDLEPMKTPETSDDVVLIRADEDPDASR